MFAAMAAGVLVVASTASLVSSASAGEVVALTNLESWYNVSPQTSLRGLPAVDPYPPATLHVGVAAGNEESRTYLTLDLSGVDPNTAGVLILPVAPDGGTRNPESAKFEVCLAPDPGPRVSGSLDPPPAMDCSVRSPAVRDVSGARFTVDLAPFSGRLQKGGLALAATAEGRASGTSWHVAFHRKDSKATGAMPITARFPVQPSATHPAGGEAVAPDRPTATAGAVEPSAVVGIGADEPVVDVGSSLGTLNPGVVSSEPIVGVAPVGASAAGGEVPSTGVAAQAVTRATSVAAGGFRYGAVFGLPLVLLAFTAYFGVALTRDVRPAAPRERVARESQEG